MDEVDNDVSGLCPARAPGCSTLHNGHWCTLRLNHTKHHRCYCNVYFVYFVTTTPSATVERSTELTELTATAPRCII